MANELDLSEFNEKELDALQAALNRKKRQRIDWDNMTHEERAMWNKTIEPRTHKTQHYEYPKSIYGRKPDGEVVRAEVQNALQEQAIKDEDASIVWKDLLRDHGIETCPSPPDKSKAAGFERIGVAPARPQLEPVPTPSVVMYEEHPAAVAAKRGPGRPPGSPNKPKQEAA